ncbi:MAG: T9SS type A sorting domain-containing protein [Saprospiraceae bacterium]|nr:T9SS type A sorting domain-containing protein [Saprospiraceae bacterium]
MNSLHGLDSLRTIGGLLGIFGNNILLNNLDGLHSLDSVGGRLIISENAQLYGLSGLEDLQHVGGVWRVAGNPTRAMATFSTVNPIPGMKRFELFDTGGRLVRLARFEGQSFEFHRESLLAGMYFFSIADERGRRFDGKIVVMD